MGELEIIQKVIQDFPQDDNIVRAMSWMYNIYSSWDGVWENFNELMRIYDLWICAWDFTLLNRWRWRWKDLIDQDMNYWYVDVYKDYVLLKEVCYKYWLDKNKYNIKDNFEDYLPKHEFVAKKNLWYVYFIKDSHWIIKVWKACDLKKRFNKYVTENSKEVKLIHSIMYDDYNEAERIWHKTLVKYRDNREWFHIPDNVMERITNCADWCFISLD